jgi:hypothetical protein
MGNSNGPGRKLQDRSSFWSRKREKRNLNGPTAPLLQERNSYLISKHKRRAINKDEKPCFQSGTSCTDYGP